MIDYIRRAMPFGDAQSLTNDELYAITAYVLYLNDIIKTRISSSMTRISGRSSFPTSRNFFDDDREGTEKEFWRAKPCMTNCAAG